MIKIFDSYSNDYSFDEISNKILEYLFHDQYFWNICVDHENELFIMEVPLVEIDPVTGIENDDYSKYKIIFRDVVEINCSGSLFLSDDLNIWYADVEAEEGFYIVNLEMRHCSFIVKIKFKKFEIYKLE